MSRCRNDLSSFPQLADIVDKLLTGLTAIKTTASSSLLDVIWDMPLSAVGEEMPMERVIPDHLF